MKFQCPNCAHAIQIANTADDADEISCPSCGSRISLLTEPTDTIELAEAIPGLRHFKFIERVGMGQFGTVWKAYDEVLGRTVAIKMPHRGRLDSSDSQLFLREARTAGHLNHPNIVTVHEIGKHGDTLFIVSEFIDGITLADWQKTYPPDFKTSAKLVASIANTLDFAHEQGIVHRDLKPGNILMDGDDVPHLTDFGLAKRDKVEATIAADGRLLGTPAYMSPEQARGEGQNADRRSDIYSLGVILFEMLTGSRPFKGGSRVLVHQVIHDPPVAPRSIRKSIPKDLETICLKALEKEPQDRYSTAKEMALDLERFLRGESIAARPPSLGTRSIRRIRRYPARAAAISLGLLSLVLVSILAYNYAAHRSDAVVDSNPVVQFPPGIKTRMVVVETKPAGGNLRFFPLDDVGLPISTTHVDGIAGKPFEVPVGEYLVVAYLKNSKSDVIFNEVQRMVPREGGVGSTFPHNKFQETSTGQVRLEPIDLFSNDEIVEEMARVQGGTYNTRSFHLQRGKRQDAEIRDFYIDVHEARDPANPARPVVNLTFHQMNTMAEAQGKYLMTEAQYLYLMSRGGEIVFESTTDLPLDQFKLPWEPPKFADNDQFVWSRSNRPILGLWAFPAELTSTRIVPQPEAPVFTMHTVMGGPKDPLPDDAFTLKWYTPIMFSLISTQTEHPLVGFRMVRSAKPRLEPADFDRLID